MLKVHFNIESGYACDLYQSCKQVGLIAQAGISSAIAFLDFLGVNGQNQSLSIITFNLTTDLEYPDTLTGHAYGCDYKVPVVNGTGVVNGYTGIDNSSCSFCQDACIAPDVDITIGFLDGFSWKLVGITYGCFIAFSVIVELVNCYLRGKRGEEEVMNPGQINSSDGNLAHGHHVTDEHKLNATDNSVSQTGSYIGGQ